MKSNPQPEQSIKKLMGVEIHISPYVSDDKLILIGAEKHTKPLERTRQLIIYDIPSGEYSGNMEIVDTRRIECSPDGKEWLVGKLEVLSR